MIRSWRVGTIAYTLALIIAGTTLIYQVNAAPGDSGLQWTVLTVLTWGLSGVVWFLCMALGFLLVALTQGAAGELAGILAVTLVFGLLGIAQVAIVRVVVRVFQRGKQPQR